MALRNHRTSLQAVVLSVTTAFFGGCDPAQPTVYEIPKEERSTAITPNATGSSAAVSDPGKMKILPGMQEAANDAPEISYTVPNGWSEFPASGIRKANFKISSDSGSAEVTLLTFPGDVGGTLANINRWRDQIGLDPATSERLGEFSEPCIIANHEGLYVRLEGARQSILGAILPLHANTWFFKMIGDTQVVLDNDVAMKKFLASVAFQAHTH